MVHQIRLAMFLKNLSMMVPCSFRNSVQAVESRRALEVITRVNSVTRGGNKEGRDESRPANHS
jgi:hypothetical protein